MHADSYSKKDLKKIIREHDRKASKYKSDVDKNRTHLNYAFCGSQKSRKVDKDAVYNRAMKRCKDILGDRYDKMKPNTNIMSEMAITYPEKLCHKVKYDTGRKDKNGKPIIREYNQPNDPEHCKRFFEVAYVLLRDRYGVDNVLGAYIHMDETTPHMHFDFVPEAVSRKNGQRTVSSASLLTRHELSGHKGKNGNGVHYDMQQKMISEFGADASDWILNGRTQGGYATDELKARSKDKAEDAKRKQALDKRENAIKASEQNIKDRIKDIIAREKALDAREKGLDTREKALNDKEQGMDDYVQWLDDAKNEFDTLMDRARSVIQGIEDKQARINATNEIKPDMSGVIDFQTRSKQQGRIHRQHINDAAKKAAEARQKQQQEEQQRQENNNPVSRNRSQQVRTPQQVINDIDAEGLYTGGIDNGSELHGQSGIV